MTYSNNILLLITGILIFTIIFTAGFFLHGIFIKLKKRSFLSCKRNEGKSGEDRAKAYLLSHGFTITKEQAYLEKHLLIDGKPQSFTLRADYLVTKKGVPAVVDAKSGIEGSQITSITTRRQLLEYFLYFNVDRAYIFDSRNNKLHEVVFPINKNTLRSKNNRLFFILVAFIIITILCIVLSGNCKLF